MAIRETRVVAEATVNDKYGVEVFQGSLRRDYTVLEARQFAQDIIDAAEDAERLERLDHDESMAAEVDTDSAFPDEAKETVR